MGIVAGDARLSEFRTGGSIPKLVGVEITASTAQAAVDHTGLTNNLYSQQQIIKALTGTIPAA